MRIPIIVPDLPSRNEPLRLGDWSVDIGDSIEQGDCLTELIAPGLALDLIAPAAGIVIELLRQPEQLVTSGDVVGWLESVPKDSGSP